MPFNGNGLFELDDSNPVVGGTTIQSTWANTTLPDIADGLGNCITKDGQTTPTNHIPFGGFKAKDLAPGTESGDAVTIGQLASTDSGKGASLIGLPGFGTVDQAIVWRVPDAVGDALADGSGTDDGPAIQAAIDYCDANGIGTLVLDNKRYGTRQTIYGKGHVNIVGQGKSASFIQRLTGSDPLMPLFRMDDSPGSNFVIPNYSGFTLQGLGNISTIGANAADQAPAFIATQKCNVDLRAYRCGGPGWYADGNMSHEESGCFAFGMLNEESGDNTNNVNWILDVESCYGDAFYSNVAPAVSENTNAYYVFVKRAFRWSGWAANIEQGRRCYVHIQQCEGAAGTYDGGDPGGQIRFGDNAIFCKGFVQYSEGDLAYGCLFEAASYGNYFESLHDVFLDDNRPEVTVVDLSLGRNSWDIRGTGENMIGIAQQSTGDYTQSGIGAYETRGKLIYPDNTPADYILISPWRRTSGSADKQQAFGRINFGARTTTTSSGFRHLHGFSDISVRNITDYSSAWMSGVGPSASNLRLVTLVYDSVTWIALAQDEDDEMFRHATYSGTLSQRLNQLFKVDSADVSSVTDYVPTSDGMAAFP